MAIALVATALVYCGHQTEEKRETALRFLSTTGKLKADQVASWVRERKGDMEVARSSAVIVGIEDSAGSDATRQAAVEPVRVFRNAYGYAAVIATDKNGKILFQDPPDFHVPAEAVATHAAEALNSKQVAMSDLRPSEHDDGHYFWISGPVFSNSGGSKPPRGALLLLIDPQKWLYPALRIWPTPSKTGETLMLIRDGDDAVYINDIRNTAPRTPGLRQPFAREATPMVTVPPGREGAVETLDFRGRPVFACTHKIPGSPWALTVKIDKAEILAPAYRENWIAGIITALSIIAAWLGLGANARRHKLTTLQENAKKFRDLVENAPAAVCINRGLEILYANPKYLQMYGFDRPDELEGRLVTDQWAPEFRPIVEDRIARRARGEPAPTEYEGRGLRKDGSGIFVRVNVSAVELPEGMASLTFMTDISAWKVEEKSRAQLASIVRSSDDAIVSKTLEGTILTWNRGAERLFGFTEQEAVGAPMLLIFPRDRYEEETQILARIGKGETVEHFETVRKTKSGQLIDVSVTISPIFDDNGRIVGASKIARDITEQKRAREALTLFRALVNCANDSIEVVDPKTGRFLDINERVSDMHGYSREEYLGLGVSDVDPVYPPIGSPEWYTRLESLREAGSLVFESQHRRKDGSLFPVEINASYVRLERDYILTVVRDVTERKNAERHIQRLNRLYAVLSGINVLIVRERDPQKLLEGACTIAVNSGKFKMAWIGMLDEASQTLKPVASAGMVRGYLDTVSFDLREAASTSGPCVQAALCGEHQISNDLANDPQVRPWQGPAVQCGYRSAAAFPLKVGGKVVGTFAFFAEEVGFFDSDELRLLDELASDVGFALDVHEKEIERRMAENNLRTSEERFRLLIENSSDIIAVTNSEGVFRFVSPSVGPGLGYAPADLLNRKIFDFIHADDVETVQTVLREALTWPERSASVEYRIRHQNGSWRYFQSVGRNVPQMSAEGYLVINSRDITESEKADRHIRRLNRVYAVLSQINELIVREKDTQALMEAACRIAVDTGRFRMSWVGLINEATQVLEPVASAGFVDGYLDSVNIDLKDTARRAGPSARCIILGEHQLCHDIAGDPAMAPWRDAAAARGYASSAAFLLKTGEKRIGVFTLYSEEVGFFDSNEVRLLSELANDISFAMEVHRQEAERKKAVEALRASEDQFSTAFEMAAIGMALVAPDGRWLKVNRAFCQMVGYTPSELYAMTFKDMTYLEDLDRDIENHRALLAGRLPSYHVEKRYVRKDGELVWIVLNTALVRDEQGNPVHFISQVQDITESRRLAEQLRQSQKMEAIGQLAGGVAHDFNNMLGAMILQGQLVLDLKGMPREAYEGLEVILSAADRAANIINQLLLFSRKQVMQAQELDLNEAVEELGKMLRRFIGEDVRLELRLSPKPVVTFADPGMFDQILMNLAVNARDAMPDGGTLIVETGERMIDESFARKNSDANPGPYVWLRVTDTGTGIAPEILPRIFEPFFTTKALGKGTGLGLATVFGTVKQHGGFLLIESELGRGTSFQVFFPACEQEDQSLEAASQAKPRGGSETILLVEDEKLMRTVTRQLLERAGYKVLEATDGVEATDLWRKNASQIHLLLTDLVMPGGLTGHQLGVRLREENPNLKIVFMTGYSPDIAGRQIEVGPFDRFVRKPFPPDKFLQTIRELLDNGCH